MQFKMKEKQQRQKESVIIRDAIETIAEPVVSTILKINQTYGIKEECDRF